MHAMRRNELLEAVRRNLGGTATRSAAEYALKAVTDSIKMGLRRDGSVRIAGFGTFLKKRRVPRTVMRPGTDEEIFIPERDGVSFRPSSSLKCKQD